MLPVIDEKVLIVDLELSAPEPVRQVAVGSCLERADSWRTFLRSQLSAVLLHRKHRNNVSGRC